jgi:hypothetical protein
LGVAARFADLYAQHYEPPKEFFYIDLLALIGAAISGRVRADVGVPCQPRLYICKIAPSAWCRKSTSMRCAEEFLLEAQGSVGAPMILRGVGSAEGLATALARTRRVVLGFDELRRFEAKAAIRGSALLPMVNELFESNRYQNLTKNQNLQIEDGHLTLITNSTDQTWQELHDGGEFKDIGLLNRIFLVTGDSSKRVPRPTTPPPTQRAPIVADLAALFAGLPALNPDGSVSSERVLPFTPQAETMWDAWYIGLEQSPETARLDTIGLRLLSLLAFTSGEQVIDEEVVRATLAMLDYQRQVRESCGPIIAENPAARMEETIRRALQKHASLIERDLRRHTNADRKGIAIFRGALKQMEASGDIRLQDGKWELAA